MKKFISMLAGVVMASSLFAVTAFAAGGNPNWSMAIDKTEVEIGEIVKVSLSTGAKAIGADIVNVYYDEAKFEYVDTEDVDGNLLSAEEAEFKLAAGTYLAAEHNPDADTVAFTWTGGGTDKSIKAKEDIAVISFKAKASGDAEFKLKEQSSGADGYKEPEGSYTDTQVVTVKGGSVEPPYEPTWEPASEKWTADNEGKQAIWWPKDYAAGEFPGFVTVKVTDGAEVPTIKTVGVGAAEGFDIEGAVSFAVAVILDAGVDATYFDCVVE